MTDSDEYPPECQSRDILLAAGWYFSKTNLVDKFILNAKKSIFDYEMNSILVADEVRSSN